MLHSSHGGNRGSNSLGSTNKNKGLVSFQMLTLFVSPTFSLTLNGVLRPCAVRFGVTVLYISRHGL